MISCAVVFDGRVTRLVFDNSPVAAWILREI